MLEGVGLDVTHRQGRAGVFTQPGRGTDMVAVGMGHDMFSHAAPVKEPRQTPPRPRESSIDDDVAAIAVDHNGVEQPARKKRTSVNPITNFAKSSRHCSTKSRSPPPRGNAVQIVHGDDAPAHAGRVLRKLCTSE